jgi:hypothetical protein
MLILCKQLNFDSELQIHYRQYNFETHNLADNSILAANYKFVANHTTSTGKSKLVAVHTIRQRMLIHCRQLSFDSESKFSCRQYNFVSESQIHYRTHNSAVNAISL